MHPVVSRLILQLALSAAFGAGQLIFAMAASQASLASAGTQVQPSMSAIIAAPPAPAGIGWG
ncbi:MAG TPA: hypothetical protein VE690_08560 [Rhodopila sp.]|nr:hypothetical protein [Rhodopila sp.]